MPLAPEQADDIDFALAAYREDGAWRLAELAVTMCASVETLAQGLRRLPGETVPGEAGALGMVAIDEDFFVLVRVTGPVTRVLLSDVSAAIEWELARTAVEFLGLLPDDDEEQEPAGDLDLVGDLGMPATDMGALLDDDELYPDEMLSEIADRLGFGPEFDAAVGLRSA